MRLGTEVGGSPPAGALPGDLLDLQQRVESNARSYPRGLPLVLARAQGWWVEDVTGRRYLDLLNGAGALPLGHNPPELVDAARRQLGTLCSALDFMTPVKAAFLERLLGSLPETMQAYRVHFCGPTGADTVEAAVKLARAATGRSGVIGFWGAYHGCTEGALAITAKRTMRAYRAGVAAVTHAPFSYCARCPVGLTRSTCGVNCATVFEQLLGDGFSGVDQPAAVVVEPVQGEGGSVPAEPDFLRRVADATRRAGALLVADEVQAGCGRTGRFLASEHYGIVPDIVCLSKALSGVGLPLGVIVYRPELDVWAPGAHIGTFRGSQPAMAAGERFLSVLQGTDLLARVRTAGARALASLHRRLHDVPWVADVRGYGFMLGVELDAGEPERSRRLAAAVQSALLARGVIVELGGRDDTTIRLLPALDIPDDVLDEGTRAVARAVEEVGSGAG